MEKKERSISASSIDRHRKVIMKYQQEAWYNVVGALSADKDKLDIYQEKMDKLIKNIFNVAHRKGREDLIHNLTT